jgi:glutamyl-tRNA synthetase
MSSEGNAVAIPAPADLTELASRITSLGDSINTLKSSSEPDKDAISAAVAALVDAKRVYAQNNGGIGVDGKKWEEPMSKSEKKKAEKAAKAAAAAAAAGGGDGNNTQAPSKAAAAKEAKKAAKKEAKKNFKEGGAPAAAPAAAASTATSPKKSSSTASAVVVRPIMTKSKLEPNQIAFNPNVSLSDRPVVALTIAILTNTIVDYELVSDHTRSGCALGLPSGNGEVSGDLAIARFIAKQAAAGSSSNLLGGDDDEAIAMMDQWVDYALSLSKFGLARRALSIQRTLDPLLVSGTYVVGHSLSLADVALFASLGFPSSEESKAEMARILPAGSPTLRWMEMMSNSPAVKEATQLAIGVAKNAEANLEDGATLDPLVAGMSYLEGATPGSTTTRFPPEPSGYLHVGHAKASLLNEYYARRYKGRLVVRFDDTNPSKEKDEYQTSIIEDLAKIGVKPDVVTFTSDYFETIKQYALWMIENGLAYMDDTPQEQMQKERMDRQHSKHRDQSPSEALEYFNLMCSGKEEGKPWCLRAKMDMSSDNGTLRDPVLYRQNTTPHHRSGTKYKAYPTYDLACPIVDSIEGVSHALRTTEYDDRNAQYQYIQKALGLRRVRIQTFARMNFMYTVMSKRKLTWFVDTGRVTGWDDPRMPTVRGVSRRGIDIDALKKFMCSQGASRRIVNMEWSKFWAENKKEIDKYAKRFMAIDKTDHVSLTVTNGGDGTDFLTTDYLPKDPSFGKRLVRIGKKVLLEKVDTEGITVGENIVLTRWGKFVYVDVCSFLVPIRSNSDLCVRICSFQVLSRLPKLKEVSRESSSQMVM